MSCEELREEYGAYALGIAEEPERVEISAHLARECPACVPGVKSASHTVAALSASVKLMDPPRSLRRRVVAMVLPNAGRAGLLVWLPWLAAAAMAVILALLIVPLRDARQGAAGLEEALSILNDPVTRDVTFGDPAARGRVFVSPGKGVMLIAAHLPKIGPEKTFELWVIPNGAKPVPAGTFNALSDSTAVYIHSGPVENAAAVAVTVEPAGGSPQPTTTPFIVTKL